MKRFRNLIKKRPCVPPSVWSVIFAWRRRTVFTVVSAVLFALPGCAVTKRLDLLNAKIGQVAGKLELLGETNRQLARLNETANSMDRRLATLEKLAKRLGGVTASQEKKSSAQLVNQPPVQNPSRDANAVPISDDDAHNSRQVIPWSADSGEGAIGLPRRASR